MSPDFSNVATNLEKIFKTMLVKSATGQPVNGLQTTWPREPANSTVLLLYACYYLTAGLVNFSCEEPDSKYFRLCTSLSVCVTYSYFSCFSLLNNPLKYKSNSSLPEAAGHRKLVDP